MEGCSVTISGPGFSVTASQAGLIDCDPANAGFVLAQAICLASPMMVPRLDLLLACVVRDAFDLSEYRPEHIPEDGMDAMIDGANEITEAWAKFDGVED